jgi:hypothetical protein
MVISHGSKFIFIHNYKVAGTSVREAIQVYTIPPKESYLNWMGQKLHMLPQSSDFPDHIKADQLAAKLPAKIFNSYYKFCFVRNPWDWQVSLYHFAKKEADHHQREETTSRTFEEYIHWRCLHDKHLQKEFMYDDKGNCLVDFVGKMENMEEDFQKVCDHLGIVASLPHSNKSSHAKYREYYTPETQQLVAEHFKEDIDLFGYSF